MTTIIRPGKYLIEKTRRSLVGVVARVGVGGSVPKLVQQAIDSYVDSVVAGSGKKVRETERQIVLDGMKKMQGTWMILSSAGLRWVTSGKLRPHALAPVDPDAWSKELAAIQNAIKGTGWAPQKVLLVQLLLGPGPGEPGDKAIKIRASKRTSGSSNKRA